MYELPTSVTVNDTEYKIRDAGDFRVVLGCFSALNDIELGEDYRILASLIIFYEAFEEIEDIPTDTDIVDKLISEMMIFFNCGKQENDNNRNMPKLIDWDIDFNIIIAAINNVAGKEVRLGYTHWWTFVGYYMSVGESVLSTVVGIRNKIIKGTKLEKWEKEFRGEHPDYFIWNSKSVEEKELDKLAFELWDSGN